MIEIPPSSPFVLFETAQARGGIAAPGGAFPPRLSANHPLPGAEDVALARRGIIFSATRVDTRAGSHVLALIDLEGGGRLLARLRSTAKAEALIGQAARLVEVRAEGEPFLTFQPESETP